MLAVAMNAHARQDVSVIRTKVAYAVNQQQFVRNMRADEMQLAVSSIKMSQNAIVHRFIQTEIHIMNVRLEYFEFYVRNRIDWQFKLFCIEHTQVHNLENLPIVDSMDVRLENVFVKARNTYANKVCFFHCSLFVCSTCLSVWFALAMMMAHAIQTKT